MTAHRANRGERQVLGHMMGMSRVRRSVIVTILTTAPSLVKYYFRPLTFFSRRRETRRRGPFPLAAGTAVGRGMHKLTPQFQNRPLQTPRHHAGQCPRVLSTGLGDGRLVRCLGQKPQRCAILSVFLPTDVIVQPQSEYSASGMKRNSKCRQKGDVDLRITSQEAL